MVIMNLLRLAEEVGLEPFKTSSTNGGEYHSSCPGCGGKDRFILWPENGHYWCRQCNVKGDAIQFCRDFQGLSFRTACIKLQKQLSNDSPRFEKQPIILSLRTPSVLWEEKALQFAECAHQRLLIDDEAVELLIERGLTMETIRQNKLGWNPVKIYKKLSEWGMEETDKRQWLCFPKGIVIPILQNGNIKKIKIRKSEWKEGDLYGKYYEVPGSSTMLPSFGADSKEVVVITEAEFDAMLVVQEAGEFCSCIALGGAQKRPDHLLQDWLLKKDLILFALDFDEAGKKAYIYWQKTFPNLEPWPVPEEKSPGDYHRSQGSIVEWIKAGIKNNLNKG